LKFSRRKLFPPWVVRTLFFTQLSGVNHIIIHPADRRPYNVLLGDKFLKAPFNDRGREIFTREGLAHSHTIWGRGVSTLPFYTIWSGGNTILGFTNPFFYNIWAYSEEGTGQPQRCGIFKQSRGGV